MNKSSINIPSWAQGVLVVGAVASIAAISIRLSKRKEEKEVSDLVWSNTQNPFNWREFFKSVKPGTTVYRYTDGGLAASKRLWDQFGFFNENEQSILTFFAAIKTQYQVAQIAKNIFEQHGIELSVLLINGKDYWLPNIGGGLSKSEVAEIYKNVKNKPVLR